MTHDERLKADGDYFNEQLGTNRGFIVTYSTITPESAEDGDISDHGFSDYEPCEPDEFDRAEGTTAVDLALKYLKQHCALNASSSHFHVGAWYSTEFETEDYRTGEQTEYSFHPKNFSLEEEAELFCRVIVR